MDQKVAKLEEHRGHADLVQEETVPGSEFGCYNLYAFVHKGPARPDGRHTGPSLAHPWTVRTACARLSSSDR